MIFDLRFLIGSGKEFGVWNQAAGPEAGAPTMAREAGAGGKRWVERWVERWVQPGEGGQKVEKQTGFSHFETVLTRLFPHDSTQVVDFPHLGVVSNFWGGHEIGFSHGWNTDKTPMQERRINKEGRNRGKEERTGRGVNHGWTTMDTNMEKTGNGRKRRGRGACPAHPHSELPGWRPSVRVCSPMFA